MAHDLVHALAELRIGVGLEAGPHTGVRGAERPPAVLAQVVAPGGDAEVHAVPVAEDRVQAQPAGSRLPLARMLVVADAVHHLPRVAAVAAAEEGGGLHSAPQLLLVVARREGPDVGESAAVPFGKLGRGLRLLERLAEVGGAQDLHPEERVAARRVHGRLAAGVDERGIDAHARRERAPELEAAAPRRRLGDEEALPGSDGEDHALRHGGSAS
jgi:hypothetical protein